MLVRSTRSDWGGTGCRIIPRALQSPLVTQELLKPLATREMLVMPGIHVLVCLGHRVSLRLLISPSPSPPRFPRPCSQRAKASLTEREEREQLPHTGL